ncbi:helix-turn-helix domain-containing protein [Streptomyces sp. NPDC008141]|uniref:helix-turn-helix domain-containing protein n=1 Tax=Streptomyces sp. NPDC008141 TaxID=3364815 RepID=UPI0036F0EC25
MGRAENPIAPCTTSLHALASWLRQRRADAQVSYTELAQRTHFSKATLSRAVSGRTVPRLVVVKALAEVCGADPAEAERLWKGARYDARSGWPGHGASHLRIDYVTTFAGLHLALLELYRRDGSRPYRELERQAGNHGQLPHATIGRVLTQRAHPRREFVLAFIQTCGVTDEDDLEVWGRAWDRAQAAHILSSPPPRRKNGPGHRPARDQRNACRHP